jgi:DNA adenine methylase
MSLLELYEKKKPRVKTPLYYMGGKTQAIKILLSCIPMDIPGLVSPFIGGGSLEVKVAAMGIPVKGYDSNGPLVSFWQEVLENPDGLADAVKEIGVMTREKYWDLCYSLFKRNSSSKMQEAAIYFALNRMSFMAQIGAGISTNMNNNLFPSLIRRLRAFRCPSLAVKELDFRKSITNNPEVFLYLDPPYYIPVRPDRYYSGNNFSEEDHFDLFSLLSKRDNWLLSYNNCPEVRYQYKDYEQASTQWGYSNAVGTYTPKEPKELLIFSNGLKERL